MAEENGPRRTTAQPSSMFMQSTANKTNCSPGRLTQKVNEQVPPTCRDHEGEGLWCEGCRRAAHNEGAHPTERTLAARLPAHPPVGRCTCVTHHTTCPGCSRACRWCTVCVWCSNMLHACSIVSGVGRAVFSAGLAAQQAQAIQQWMDCWTGCGRLGNPSSSTKQHRRDTQARVVIEQHPLPERPCAHQHVPHLPKLVRHNKKACRDTEGHLSTAHCRAAHHQQW